MSAMTERTGDAGPHLGQGDPNSHCARASTAELTA